ncbi:MAG: citrate lyase holo-[acyl-carrier protein] synthase, partial [Oscillospiraceae bacterium]
YEDNLLDSYRCIIRSIKNKILKEFYENEYKVTLNEMLLARENRVVRQNELINSGKSLICFTLNIAGECKNSPIISKVFDEGVSKIKQTLNWNDILVEEYQEYKEKTGCEAYLLTNDSALKLKELMTAIEDGFELGRLFDIDIIKADGKKVCREEIGLSQRNCIVCKKQGAGCARSRAHSIDEIVSHTIDLICDYFTNKYTDYVAQSAVKALLYEVCVTPKPGLVDRADNGAHKDMDICEKPLEYIFKQLRYIGRLAEDEMFKQTNGINTHKGAIFSLGIISAALGYIYANNTEKTIENILCVSADMAKNSLKDFQDVKTAKTFGEQVFISNKLTGIRGEAAKGYTSVKNISYPILLDMMTKGFDTDTCGIVTLLNLIAQVEDTNIIKRTDINTLHKIQQQVKEMLKDKTCDIKVEASKLNEYFIKANISAGGCADLLAVTFMLYFVLNGKEI